MTLKKILPLIIAIAPLFASAQKLTCTTHERTNVILERSAEKRALVEQLNREAELYTTQHYGERAGGLKVIPTVIHVIHENGAENISKESILSIMEFVNLELRGQNNTSTVSAAFQNIIGDTQFELRLAKIDENGNCTDGITRTVSSQTNGAGEGVKDLVNWNDGSRRYLQVWLVASVGGGAGGYTYLPGSVSARANGIIIRTAQFTGTLSHEFGHWLNLSHTWGPTNDPAVASNCNFDDNVSDTPNTEGQTSCSGSRTTCGSVDNVENHMDYTSCARMFTLGQAARMQSASNSTTGGRSTYWASGNRSATGTNDGFTNSCVPTIAFGQDNAQGCEGLIVDFEDNSFGADLDASWDWEWSFPGGTPSTSDDQNPTVTYNSAGTYNVTLTITNNAGTDSRTVQNAVVVNAFGGGLAGFTEDVEDSGFPNNAGNNKDWSIESAGGLTWQRSDLASATGNASVRINLRNITEGDINDLITPPLDMSNVSSSDALLTFKYAHANRNSTSHSERLRIFVSDDCGESWKLRFTATGDGLNTAGNLNSGIFTPDASDWVEESVSLGVVAGEGHVLVRFEATSDRQSYLYIDDININTDADGVGIEEAGAISDMQVYPNPIDGNSQLEISMKEAVNAEISLLNVMGQTLRVNQQQLGIGTNRFSLSDANASLQAGLYLLQVRSDIGTKTVRFVKN